MEPTITENGALFCAHHRVAKGIETKAKASRIKKPGQTVPTVRTSVGSSLFGRHS